MTNARRKSGPAVVLLVAAVLSGCASAGRQAAIRLADDGGAAARKTESLIAQTSGRLQPYVEGQYLLAPIRGTESPAGGPGASNELLDLIDQAERALRLRAQVMANLADAYAAMKTHASFDAASEMEGAIEGLTGGLDAYAAALGAGPIPAVAAFVVGKTAGAVAAHRQVRQLKAASAAVRDRLTHFQRLLAREAEVIASINAVTTITAATNARVLWDLGLGQPDEIFRSHLAVAGFDYDPKQFGSLMKALAEQRATGPPPKDCPERCASKADRLRCGVASVVAHRARRAAQLELSAAEKHAAALAGLIAAHADFEAGRYVDTSAVASELETLKAIVDELAELRGSKPSAS